MKVRGRCLVIEAIQEVKDPDTSTPAVPSERQRHQVRRTWSARNQHEHGSSEAVKFRVRRNVVPASYSRVCFYAHKVVEPRALKMLESPSASILGLNDEILAKAESVLVWADVANLDRYIL